MRQLAPCGIHIRRKLGLIIGVVEAIALGGRYIADDVAEDEFEEDASRSRIARWLV